MTWLDYSFLGVVLVSLVIGLFRGFVREALSLATWLLAFVLALRFGPEVASRIGESIHAPALRTALGYGAVFFGVLLAGALVTFLVAMLIRSIGLTPVDRMLGAGFGLVRGALIVVAAVMFAGLNSLHEESWWRASRLVPEVRPWAGSLQNLIPERWLQYLRPAATAPVAPVGPLAVKRPEH